MVEKKGQMSMMNMIVVGFIAILLGIVFLGILSDSTNSITDVQSTSNESFTGVDSVAVALTNDNMEAVGAIRNSTGDVLTVTTDYTVNLTPGTITVLTGNGTYFADYSYFGDNYVEDTASRSLMNIVIILFAIGVLAVSIFVVFPKIQDMFGL